MTEQGRGGSAPGTGRSGDRLASATLGALRRGGGKDASASPPEPDVTEPDVTEPDVTEPDVTEPDATGVAAPPAVDGDEPATASKPVRLDKATRSRPRTATATPVAPAEPAAKPRRRASRWTTVCALVAFAALVFAVVTGVRWWTADHNTERRVGAARVQISKDAKLTIATVNTSDYRKPSAALDNWLQATTGSLHAQYEQSRSTVAKLLGEAKMITKATVLDAAVTDINLTKGSASVIASVNVTRTPTTGSPTTVRNRLRATMTHVGGQWKLSDLATVPVSLS